MKRSQTNVNNASACNNGFGSNGGIGLLEGTNLSVGRGTDTPFEILGAPWCDGTRLWQQLQRAGLAGISFVPVRFTPNASKFRDQECSGIRLAITDRARFQPIATGLAIACALRDLFEQRWRHDRLQWLLRNREVYEGFCAGQDYRELQSGWRQDTELFKLRRRQFLIYR